MAERSKNTSTSPADDADDCFSFGASSVEELMVSGATASESMPISPPAQSMNAPDMTALSKQVRMRDGEIAVLRQRLAEMEARHHDSVVKHIASVDSLEREKTSLVSHLQTEVSRLNAELSFKHHTAASAAPEQAPSTNSMVASFSDLHGAPNALPVSKRRRSARVSTGNPAEELAKVSLSPPPPQNLGNILLQALGQADQIWAIEDTTAADLDEIRVLRDRTQQLALLHSNSIFALDMALASVVSLPRFVLSSYMATVIQFFVCAHTEAASAVARASLADSVPYSSDFFESPATTAILKAMCIEFFAGPRQCSLLENCATLLSKLPAGECTSVVHRILVILTHCAVVPGVSPIPPSIAMTIRSPALQRHVFARDTAIVVSAEQILIDTAALLHASVRDPIAISSLIARVSEPADCSLLAAINRILTLRMISVEDLDKHISNGSKSLFRLLFYLVSKRVLPASVAFEPATVRAICRRLTESALHLRDCASDSCQHVIFEDTIALLQIVHYIAIVEKAPLASIALREAVGLIFTVRQFSQSQQIMSSAHNMILQLSEVTEHQLLTDLLSGKLTPLELPHIRMRDQPLTHDEEMAMYRKMNIDL